MECMTPKRMKKTWECSDKALRKDKNNESANLVALIHRQKSSTNLIKPFGKTALESFQRM